MPDIVIPEEDLPEVTIGENGWMSIDSASFPPVSSAKLCWVWAKRYIAAGYFLEAQEELSRQTTDMDRLLSEVARQVYGKAYSRCTNKQKTTVGQVAELYTKAQAYDKEHAPTTVS